MDCLDIETIEAYVMGFLDEATSTRLAEHIRHCPRCEEEIRKTQLVYKALGHLFATESREECPSGEKLADFSDGLLPAAEVDRISRHVKVCVYCAADLYYLQKQSHALPAAVLEATATLASKITIPPETWAQKAGGDVYKFPEHVALAMFAPAEDRQKRLAAGTGKGFGKQLLADDKTPFQIEMVQFGSELRLTISLKEGSLEPSDGLVAVLLSEGKETYLAQVVRITEGKGSCSLSQALLEKLPRRQPVYISIAPLDASKLWQGSGAALSADVLLPLLKDADASLRQAAVELLGEIGDPAATEAVAALKNDPDESVRNAATAAIRRLT